MIAARPAPITLAVVQIGNRVAHDAAARLVDGLKKRMLADHRLINKTVTGRMEWPPDMPLTDMLLRCAEALRASENYRRLAALGIEPVQLDSFLTHYVMAAQDALLTLIME